MGYLMPILSILKYNNGISLWDEGIHTFPNGISLKVNVIAKLEFELSYFEARSNILATTPQGTPQRNVTKFEKEYVWY